MNVKQAFKMAFKSIWMKKMRSFLTMLGIIIGVAAVIIMVSVVQGQNQEMKDYYNSLGSNKINISASSWNSESVSTQLYQYCLGLSDLVVGVTPNIQNYGATVKYDIKSYGGENGWDDYENMPNIALGNNQYSLCMNYTIAKGRDLSYLDVEKYNQVCVLGARICQNLFNYADPVGKVITINGNPFTVIGVFESKATTISSDQDNVVLVPYTMNRLLNNSTTIDSYVAKAASAEATTEAITRLDGFLKGIINTDSGYYYVQSDNQYIEDGNNQNLMMSLVLGGIAGISLLVGGIGIMNIMLVTVTERTREIGIRKAIGAERRSIIAQFLIEASVICGIGGLMGIAVGYLGSLVAGKLILDTVLLPGKAITLGAFLISVGLGILFGMYPAVKASGLQPVEALRAE